MTSPRLGPDSYQLLPALYLESGRINGKSLKRYRQMHDITQAQLASILSLSERTISSAEAGNNISKTTAEALAYFVHATANIVAEHGIVPPDMKFSRFFGMEGRYRKETTIKPWIKDFLIEAEPRVIQLKVKVNELELELQRKDMVIRDLVRSKTKDITGMQREIDRLRESMEQMKQAIGEAA